MIFDQVSNFRTYFKQKAWFNAFNFLEQANASMNDGHYEIDGDNIDAKVMSYQTRTREQAVLESHRKYIDIQSTLVGAEGMDWLPIQHVDVLTNYDAERDVVFYEKKTPIAHLDVFSGYFVGFFPNDAHMPQLIVGDKSEFIKKIVIKIQTKLWIP